MTDLATTGATTTGSAAAAPASVPPLLRMAQETPTRLWNDSATPARALRRHRLGCCRRDLQPGHRAGRSAQRPAALADPDPAVRRGAPHRLGVRDRLGDGQGAVGRGRRAAGRRVHRAPRAQRPAVGADRSAAVPRQRRPGRPGPRVRRPGAQRHREDPGDRARHPRRWKRPPTAGSASTRPSRSPCRRRSPWPRRSSAVCSVARPRGTTSSAMGPVCTIMVGRLDDWLKTVAKRDVVTVDPGVLEWAGVAVFKHAYEIFQQRGFRTRLLSAAFRNHMHWSQLVGGDVVISPPFEWQVRLNASGIEPLPRIDEPVDPAVLDTLYTRFPEFRRAYDADGMSDRRVPGVRRHPQDAAPVPRRLRRAGRPGPRRAAPRPGAVAGARPG